MADTARTVVERLFEALETKDTPAARALLADDVDWLETPGLPWGGQKVGDAAVLEEVLGPRGELVPDLQVLLEEVHEDGDTVTTLHRYTGAGGALDVLGCSVATVGDGKVTRFRQFIDSETFNSAIGR